MIVGHSQQIKVGLAAIKWMENIHIISTPTIHYLNNKGLYTFNQLATQISLGWSDAKGLELSETSADEWDRYYRQIQHEGITLTEKEDTLSWGG